MSHLTHTMVEQFFELEKESARGVLRKEMDSAMDTIFKQMKRKLMMLVECGDFGNETGHGLAHLGDPTDNEQQLYKSSNQIPSPSTISYVPDNANSNQNDEIIVKNELGEFVNIIPMPASSTQPYNDQSNYDDLFGEFDDDDCDCPECVGNLFVKMEEGVDYSVQFVEDLDESDDSNPKPTKRCRLENDQSQKAQTESYNQNLPNYQYITISLKCPQCSEMFQDKYALNVHLKSVHSIEKHRCLYKDCNLSFDDKIHLSRHYITAHQTQPNITLPCGYCSGNFKNSKTLLTHYSMHHQEGLFQCTHPNCQFVAELKQTVYYHFGNNHKDFVCQYPGCAKRYSCAAILKTHQRTHLNAKPYRCKWPKCEYSGSAYKHHAMRHIRIHLAKIVKLNQETNISDDPNDYLKVVQELL